MLNTVIYWLLHSSQFKDHFSLSASMKKTLSQMLKTQQNVHKTTAICVLKQLIQAKG